MTTLIVSSVLEAREALAEGRSAVVVVPVYEAYDDLVQCIGAILRHTPADADVLLIDDGSTDPRVKQLGGMVQGSPHRVVVWSRERNAGFVRTMNDAFVAAGRRDVVLVNSDVIVGPQWFERLREAAYSDSRVATATPLSNHGTILSAPHRNQPGGMSPGMTPERAALAVATMATKLRPRIPTCVGHCAYIKRMALDVIGGFDETFSPGYGEEVDFSQRCILSGLAHVCADDVFVYHRGGASFGRSAAAETLRTEHERLIAGRYPFYHAWVARTASSETGALAAAIGNARRALFGLSIAIDATALGPLLTGTQRGIIEVVRVLARHPDVSRIRLVLPSPPPAYVQGAFSNCPKLEPVSSADAGQSPADVAFRPSQVFTAHELALLRSLGRSIFIGQLDFIAFNNPGYFPDASVWRGYRDVTRLALAVADGVTFISRHCENEARSEGLLAPGRPTKVIYYGTDHSFLPPAPIPPSGLPAVLSDAGYLLCLGTDYRHKNRLFALRTFAHMRARGYGGYLVLAGPQMEYGSSRPAEAGFLLGHPDIARLVVTLGEVSESERAWLLARAALVLHPTLYEGFGLTPFEAAADGVPCLSSRLAALAEILPADAETISDWDPEVVASQALGILRDPERRRALIDALVRRGRDFTWDRVATRLVEFFETVCAARPEPTPVAIEGDRDHRHA